MWIIIALLSFNTWAGTDTVGFIVNDQAQLFRDARLTKVVGFAKAKQQVIMVHSSQNTNSSQKINIDGFNFWIHLKDLMIVDYPEFFEGNKIDQDRGRIIKEYLKRL